MARILVIDDDLKICLLLTRIIEGMHHEVFYDQSLKEGLHRARSDRFDVILLDLTLPDGNGLSILPELTATPSNPEVIIVTGTGDQRGAEVAFTNGAWDFVPKPFLPEEVALPVTRALQYREQKVSVRRPKVLWREGILGSSPKLKTCLELVAQAAATDANVLISGETGTGKELFARAIHENGRRAEGNFVVVDCTALPATLVESTLFGHEKGAFTGADQSAEGLFRQAHGGTLFLDEIGELPLAMQKAFLRVLQERSFRPVGSRQEVTSDFHLVAATNRNLEQMSAQDLFREDLLYRLRAVTLHLPPLRERKEDITDLTVHHITRICDKYRLKNKGFAPEFFEVLREYQWPGNVRELVNTLEGALAAAGDSPILYPKHLPTHLRLHRFQETAVENKEASGPVGWDLVDLTELPQLKDYREALLSRAEEAYLTELMKRTKGRISEACAAAGLSESRLHALLKKYDTPRFR
jgi:two-component system NtrC family response regulator